MTGALLAGVFVGGDARRMGGRPKGLLPHPVSGMPLAQHVAMLASAAGAQTVLVGRGEAYAQLGIPVIPDEPTGIGPMGGLASLLGVARGRVVLALACDLAHLEAPLIRTLVQRLEADLDLDAVVPSCDGRLEPLCATYRSSRVVSVVERNIRAGRHALHEVVRALCYAELQCTNPFDRRMLQDWDTPEDVARTSRR